MRLTESPLDCIECEQWYFSLPVHIVGAASSVGISRNMSTAEVLRAYVRDYHAKGHKE